MRGSCRSTHRARWSATRCCCSSCAARRHRRTRITSGCPGRCCSRRCCRSPSRSAIDRRPARKLTLPMFDPHRDGAARRPPQRAGGERVRRAGQQRVRSGALAMDGRAARHRSRVAHLDRFDERRAPASPAGWTSRGASCSRRSCSGCRSSAGRTRWRSRTGRPTSPSAAPPCRRTATSTRRRRSRRTSGCRTNIGALRLRLTGADLVGLRREGIPAASARATR